MSLNSLNKYLTNNTLWIFISISILAFYLSPLFYAVFYVPIFDNLDSIVVYYKILSESGKIFADNNSIIPNMMNGLPRSSYPGEFNIILWLYYFFEPKTAFIINEILIHLVAFLSMFIFLQRYIIPKDLSHKNIPIFISSLYFSLIPYWSGAGLSIAILPLVTYSLLNIKNKSYSKWNWILLALLPLYTSFIFLYMFYIILAGIYMIWDAIKYRHINTLFILALILMGTTFLISEYRLIVTMFFDPGFTSHRTEFNIFFKKDFLEIYRNIHLFILNGHMSHASALQDKFILPTILISMLLGLGSRQFNKQESKIIFIIIIITFILNIWNTILTNIYTIPLLFLFILIFIFYTKEHKLFGFLFLIQLILTIVATIGYYKGLEDISSLFPIFRTLNISRIAFVEPFIWASLFSFSIIIMMKRLYYTPIFIIILIIFQFSFSIERSFYQTTQLYGYASFQQYYAPTLFDKIKKIIPEPIENIRIVSYGLEPAITLYNGFYTIDGYSVNYPLEYKYKFRKIIQKYLDNNSSEAKKAREVYDDWGGKVYILNTTARLDFYNKDITEQKINFDSHALCDLHVHYLISSKRLQLSSQNELIIFKEFFKGATDSWDIYLYSLNCTK